MLTEGQRATLDAAARVILPAAYDPTDGPCVDVVSRLDRELTLAPAALRDDILRALNVFGSAVASSVTVRARGGFATLSPEKQRAMLTAWSRSPIALQRTVFQAIRRVILGVYYGDEDVQRALGRLEPLHTRAPQLAHEGPAEARAHAAPEPVARAPFALPVATSGSLGVSLRDTSRLRADVVVIGSGAGGAVAAMKLAEAGRSVVILEEGGLYRDAELSEREAEMTAKLFAERGLRTTEDLSVSLLQGRSVGGGTTVNWMIMLRTPEHVLDEWADHHGTVGMRAADLAPVFDEIEAITHTHEVPDDAHSPNNRALLDGARALGWSARSARINARDCVRAGTCSQGCRYGAKQGAQRTFLPRAMAAGAKLFSGARVERIETLSGRTGRFTTRRVHAAVIDPETGARRDGFTVDAQVVIVAAGAIETPALLQRSGMGGGGVGRYLRLHPTTLMLGRYEREMQSASGIPLSSLVDEFARRDAQGYGYWIECPPLYPMIGSVVIPGVGAAHRRLMREWSHLGAFIALVRDGADTTRSDGDVRVDRNGRTRIRYALAPRDAEHMRQAMAAAARIHLAAGAREVVSVHTDPVRIAGLRDLAELGRRSLRPNDLTLVSAHVNGTCRIGPDRQTSGVNHNGERHGHPGVFVLDGSALPTAPGVNPQETIMAVAWVLADRIAQRM